MFKFHNLVLAALLAIAAGRAWAQPHGYSWQEIRDEFETNNTTLLAGKLNLD